ALNVEQIYETPSQRGLRSGVLAPSTPLLHSGRIVVRSDRPSSIVAPNRNITKVEIGDVGQQPQLRPGQVEQHRAAARATVLERLPQALAGLVSDRPLQRD